MKRLDNGMLIELSKKTGRGPKREEREKGEREELSLSHPWPPAAHLFIRLRSNELSPRDTHVTCRVFKTGKGAGMVMNKTIGIQVTWTSLRKSVTYTRVLRLVHTCASLSLLMRVPPQAPCIINTFSARDQVFPSTDVHSMYPIEAMVVFSTHSHLRDEIFAYCNDEDNSFLYL